LSTTLKSTGIVTVSGIVDGYITIDDGIITAVLARNEWNGNDSQINDYGDSVIMPGLIDPHVHINEPGRTDWEGFFTATKAAAMGGITTLVEMPLNAHPVTTTAGAFAKKEQACQGKLHTNMGFWGGIVPGNNHDIEPLIKAGVLGFKAFLSPSGIDDFENVAKEDLQKVLPLVAGHGLPLLLHCEIVDNINRTPTDPTNYQQYMATRPTIWEDNAIALAIQLCEAYNCRVHIVHLSAATSLKQIIEAKQKGLSLTVETAQHYLYFTAEEILTGQTAFKCAPPIRGQQNNQQLWNALMNGTIDFVATDHSPCTPDLKALESGDFMKAWGGIASLQFALPIVWTKARQHNATLQQLAYWLSEGPSKLIGLDHCKGKIAPGYHADLVVWNPEQSFRVTNEIIEHKNKITPYIGQMLTGVTEATYLQGKKIYSRGDNLVLQHGQLLKKLP